MSITLNLPLELETELAAEAAQLGISLPDYALQILAGERNLHHGPRTGAELLAYWQGEGLVGARSDIVDPTAHATILREQSQHRVRP